MEPDWTRPVLFGTAWRHAAEQHKLAEAIAELREMAAGRNDVLAEAAGITAGSWCANPAGHVGTEMLVAGMLIMAGGHDGKPLDYAELERLTRVGYERGLRSRQPGPDIGLQLHDPTLQADQSHRPCARRSHSTHRPDVCQNPAPDPAPTRLR